MVAIWLLACGVQTVAQADGARQGSPDFVVDLWMEDRNGTLVYQSEVSSTDCPLTIFANISIAEGRPDSSNTTVSLFIDKGKRDELGLGPLHGDGAPASALYTYVWQPEMPAMYDIEVRVANGTDAGNGTSASISSFTVLGPQMVLSRGHSSDRHAVIGYTNVTIIALVANYGNQAGVARVDFSLVDGPAFASVSLTVSQGGDEREFLVQTVFTSDMVDAGWHTVQAVLAGQPETQSWSGYIEFFDPTVSLHACGLEFLPDVISVGKGSGVPVEVFVDVENRGNSPSANFTIRLFEGESEVAGATVELAVKPGARSRAAFTWNVTDALLPGRHTISAGTGSEDPLTDYLPEANLTVLGVAGLYARNLTVTPDTAYEGTEVLVSAVLVNDGNADAAGQAIEFWPENASGAGFPVFGRVRDINVRVDESVTVTLRWTLPAVQGDSETWRVWAHLADSIQGAARVTILKKRAVVSIERFEVPGDVRIGDMATFSARVRNTGNLPATGVTVEFFDGDVFLGTGGPFDLPSGAWRDVYVSARMVGAGDADHEFTARCGNGTATVKQTVGRALAPGNIVIAGFGVYPDEFEEGTATTRHQLRLTLVLRNTGDLPGTASVDIVDTQNNSIVLGQRVEVAPGERVTRTYDWNVRGAGPYTALATVKCSGRTATSSATAGVRYRPPAEDLLPYLVPAAAISMTILGIWMLFGRARPAGAGGIGPRTAPARERGAGQNGGMLEMAPGDRGRLLPPDRLDVRPDAGRRRGG